MNFQTLKLINFRNHSDKTISFTPHTTVLMGKNAAGKTNILEALFLLSTGHSFHADSQKEMISWNKEISRIKATISPTERELVELEVILTTGMVSGIKTPLKKYAINDVGKRIYDFTGIAKTVLFWPEDMELVTASPSLRRRYLDFVLSQTDREYHRTLVSYEKGLRQRNKLLEQIRDGTAHTHQLLFWDQLLIKDGSYISKKREEFILFVNSAKWEEVGKQLVRYSLSYDKSVISRQRLDEYAHAEVSSGVTLVGPHRDDFTFQINNDKLQRNDLSHYGSRGEQRIGVLWLKLGELSYIETITHEKPVLLLDDIFSELDYEHRRIVYDIIQRQQTIMTTIDENLLEVKTSTTTIIKM